MGHGGWKGTWGHVGWGSLRVTGPHHMGEEPVVRNAFGECQRATGALTRSTSASQGRCGPVCRLPRLICTAQGHCHRLHCAQEWEGRVRWEMTKPTTSQAPPLLLEAACRAGTGDVGPRSRGSLEGPPTQAPRLPPLSSRALQSQAADPGRLVSMGYWWPRSPSSSLLQ